MLVKKFKAKIDSVCSRFEKRLNDDSSYVTKFLFKLALYSAVAAFILLIIDFWQILKGNGEKIGVFGDFFGGILNPILTFLTFLGLIATIIMQRQELKQSRVEYEKTSESLKTQAIETTFFNILDLHHKIVDNIKVNLEELRSRSGNRLSLQEILNPPAEGKSIFEGRGAFEEILNLILHHSSSPAEVVERYKVIQNENNHVLGHYFRNLYQALKVIHGYEDLAEQSKRKYASILRAQLSAKELALLFINCLEGVCDRGQFKNLVIEYKMLEHLPIEKTGNWFVLVGSGIAIADDEMILQYKKIKDLPIELEKVYGGAFGQNGGIPYHLR